ncbi:unnamed protein product [Haemonchus placei]|uniref:SUN domain-containing protein n=1 Tax=Haemonchus placei TaxID=6290 RepID=A0A0N4W8R8_HAEPC|nr:unnamed protein product [Haemonchus placei]
MMNQEDRYLGPDTFSGKCDVSSPPTSWLVTTAIGITKYATAGVSANGDQFCVTSTALLISKLSHIISAGIYSILRDPKSSAYNGCVMDDPQIHVCFPFCDAEKQEIAIKAALSSGTPSVVAGSIEKSLNNPEWAITVLQVDFNNPEAHLNVTSFPDPNVWCSVYIGIDPRMGFPYLFEIQLGKVIQ